MAGNTTASTIAGKPRARRALWHLRRFLGREDGQATVEFVILLPAYLVLFGGIFSMTMTLFSVGRVWDVSRDVARRVAVGELTDAEGEALAVSMLPTIFRATAGTDASDADNVRLSVTIDPSFNILGSIGVFFADGITSTYVMRRETAS